MSGTLPFRIERHIATQVCESTSIAAFPSARKAKVIANVVDFNSHAYACEAANVFAAYLLKTRLKDFRCRLDISVSPGRRRYSLLVDCYRKFRHSSFMSHRTKPRSRSLYSSRVRLLFCFRPLDARTCTRRSCGLHSYASSFQMAFASESGGVGALVRHTEDIAQLAVNTGHPDQKHNEFLPFPDEYFDEEYDPSFLRGLFVHSRAKRERRSRGLDGKFTVLHLYNRDGRTFVPNVPVEVISITAVRTYAAFAEFLNPYL